jgi:U3 small nucleolar RNA-associated protein 25
MDDGNSITTKLLTLLNVSATKVGKRKRTYEDHLGLPDKLNKRKSTSFVEPTPEVDEKAGEKAVEDVDMEVEADVAEEEQGVDDDEEDESMYVQIFTLMNVLIKQTLRIHTRNTLEITLSL